MPNPTQSDLHVNVPLTNVSVAYMQDKATFIADKVFPRVPVQKQSRPVLEVLEVRLASDRRAEACARYRDRWCRLEGRHGAVLRRGLGCPQGHRRPDPRQRRLQLAAGLGRHHVRHQPAPASSGPGLERLVLQDRRRGAPTSLV